MNRDVAHYAINKLQGDWSAPDFTKSLTREVLATLVPRFEKLDPLVRVRLLLSALLLPPEARSELSAELKVRTNPARHGLLRSNIQAPPHPCLLSRASCMCCPGLGQCSS